MRAICVIVTVVAVSSAAREPSEARGAADAAVAQRASGTVQWERLIADAGYPPRYRAAAALAS